MKHQYWYRKFICVICGDEFRATRGDAKTCSPACRKRLSRHAENRENTVQSVLANIQWLKDDKLVSSTAIKDDIERVNALVQKLKLEM